MIQAAIDPVTKEFLGLIIPAEDLDGTYFSVHGTAADWSAAVRGEPVDSAKIGVIRGTIAKDCTMTFFDDTPEPPGTVEVENLNTLGEVTALLGRSRPCGTIGCHMGSVCNRASCNQTGEGTP